MSDPRDVWACGVAMALLLTVMLLAFLLALLSPP